MAPTTETQQTRLEAALAEHDPFRRECGRFHNDLEHLHDELELQDGALAATATHFPVADMRRQGWPVVHVNRAIAARSRRTSACCPM